MSEIEKYGSLIALICKGHHVKVLYAFGSVLSEKFHIGSDIDLMVKFDKVSPEHYFENFLSFKESLENIFHRKVDLLEEQTLRNPVLIRSINRNKKIIYG